MARKLFIVLINTDPRNGEELGAPFFQAAVAAAMDYEVEVICAGTAGRLMQKGVAAALPVKAGSERTAYDYICEAHTAGARIFVCSASLELLDKTEADLIPECIGRVGWANMIAQVMEDDCRVLTY
jgi:predicted peroxiredoxin